MFPTPLGFSRQTILPPCSRSRAKGPWNFDLRLMLAGAFPHATFKSRVEFRFWTLRRVACLFGEQGLRKVKRGSNRFGTFGKRHVPSRPSDFHPFLVLALAAASDPLRTLGRQSSQC